MLREVLVAGFVVICLSATSQFLPSYQGPGKFGSDVKGKPFVRRLVPGITFQIPGTRYRSIDAYIVVGYRVTTRLTTGFGWNERLGFRFHHHFGFSHRRGVYGPRIFVDYKITKGFSVRGELESMNAYVVPPITVTPGGIGERRWVAGVLVGVKKDFIITRRLRLNLQGIYELSNETNHSPYSDRLNFRLGFEFSLMK